MAVHIRMGIIAHRAYPETDKLYRLRMDTPGARGTDERRIDSETDNASLSIWLVVTNSESYTAMGIDVRHTRTRHIY